MATAPASSEGSPMGPLKPLIDGAYRRANGAHIQLKVMLRDKSYCRASLGWYGEIDCYAACMNLSLTNS